MAEFKKFEVVDEKSGEVVCVCEVDDISEVMEDYEMFVRNAYDKSEQYKADYILEEKVFIREIA